MIKADITSDDNYVMAEFNAERWFAYASNEDITKLKTCGFGGDYLADEVAHYLRNVDGGIEEVLAYVEKIHELNDEIGFEVHIDEDDAENWLKNNRPALYTTLYQ